MANIEGAAPIQDPATKRAIAKLTAQLEAQDQSKVEARDALAQRLASEALAPPSGVQESRPVQEMKAKLDTGMTEEMKAVFSAAMAPYQGDAGGLKGRVSPAA